MLVLSLSLAMMPKAQACSAAELDRTLNVADEGFHPPDDAPDLARQAALLILKLRECDKEGIVYPDAGAGTHGIILGIESKLDCKLAQVQKKTPSQFCASLGYWSNP